MRTRAPDKRVRALTTPEGIALPVTIASRGARVAALALDLGLIFGTFFIALIVLVSFGGGFAKLEGEQASPVIEFILIVLILAFFLARYGYFLAFELGPRGATPGKRALGIRVAARAAGGGGGRLSAEAVIARNLIRDAELFLPLIWLFGGLGAGGMVSAAAGAWLAAFALFPFFNRDSLRAGDLIAGTWVIEARRPKLPEAMSVNQDYSADYQFDDATLSAYGEHELQVLERVLREDRPEALRQVTETICAKFGWQPGQGDEREFLETFYSALRAKLERDMRFGRRKKDKYS